MPKEKNTRAEAQFKPVSGKLPTITIPDTAGFTDYGGTKFQVDTDAGTVRVEEGHRHLECAGTSDALIRAGVAYADWFIEGRKSWSVMFNDGKAVLRIGGRGIPKGPYVGIDTYCAPGEYRVFVPTTKAQRKELDKRREGWKAQKQAEARNALDDDMVLGLGVANSALAGDEIDRLASYLGLSGGMTYSRESEARILRLLGELRRAFTEARMVRVVPKYQQRGNVVCWPGRGSVAPVMLQ